MQYDRPCPKCGCTYRWIFPGTFDMQGHGNYINCGGMKWVGVDRHICQGCGFVEEWVKPTSLPFLRQRIGVPYPMPFPPQQKKEKKRKR